MNKVMRCNRKRRNSAPVPGEARIALRLPESLLAALQRLAAAEDRSLSSVVRRALQAAVADPAPKA